MYDAVAVAHCSSDELCCAQFHVSRFHGCLDFAHVAHGADFAHLRRRHGSVQMHSMYATHTEVGNT